MNEAQRVAVVVEQVTLIFDPAHLLTGGSDY
jgi:hypothetical protein